MLEKKQLLGPIMSKGNERSKGDAYMAEAEKILNKTSISSIFGFGKTQKFEEAAEAYIKAGNAYKLSNFHESAGNAFLQAAENYLKTDGCATEGVNNLVEAANNFKKVDPVRAIETFQRAIERFNDAGRFGMSARYFKEIAEIFEADGNKSSAANAYEQAAAMFDRDNKKSNGSTCMLKVAQFSAEGGDYAKAAQIFDSNGKEGLASRLGAFGAKNNFLMALLCYLALGDTVQVTNKLNEYKNLDHSFPGSRESGFVEKLVEATDAMDAESFSDACSDFDRISPLDPLKTSLLLRAKQHIADASGAEVDLS